MPPTDPDHSQPPAPPRAPGVGVDQHVGTNYGTMIGVQQHVHPPERRLPLWVNVPPRPALVLGRADLLADLVQRLTAGHSPALSADGLPGVGKTTLAILLAYDERVCAHFPDGALWAGLGPCADVASVQAAWGDALGANLSQIPDVHRRQARLSAAVSNRRVLVVLDDVWADGPAQQLRLSGPHVGHILTTRNTAIARAFAGPGQAVKVPVLGDETAWALLRGLAPEACAAAPGAARALADAAGGLPLAVELLGGYLAAPERSLFPDLSAAALAELGNPARRLALAKERLGSVTSGPETLAAVIRLSVEELEQAAPPAAAAFHALGAFAPKPATFARTAAEAVTGADAATLALLVGRNLVEIGADENLAVHQVVHDGMAAELPAGIRERHADYFLAQVNADREDWQRIEKLWGQVQHAWRQLPDEDVRVVHFSEGMRVFFGRRGLSAERLSWTKRALAYCRTIKDTQTEATLLNNIGVIYADLGDKRQALAYYEQALALYRQVGEKGGEAATLNNFGRVYADLGAQRQALASFQQALSLHKQMGEQRGEAASFNGIGGVCAAQGDRLQALVYHRQALVLYRQAGDKDGEAATLNNLGSVHAALRDQRQALVCNQAALVLYRQVGDKGGEAASHNGIGVIHAALGEQAQAITHFEQALRLHRQTGDRGGEAATLNEFGRVCFDLGEQDQALAYFEQALLLRRQVEDRRGEAATLHNIGRFYAAQGNPRQALDYHDRAHTLYRQVGDKGGEAATLNSIGIAYAAQGNLRQALACYEQALPLDRHIGDKSGEAATLNNIGRAYAVQGNPRQALDCYERALALYRQVGDKGGEAESLDSIGLVFYGQGQPFDARPHFEQAQLLHRQVGDWRSEAATLNNLGLVYTDLNQLADARVFHEQALLWYTQARDYWGEKATRRHLAAVFEGLGNLERAEQELLAVVAIDEAVDHTVSASDLRAIARIQARRRRGMRNWWQRWRSRAYT